MLDNDEAHILSTIHIMKLMADQVKVKLKLKNTPLIKRRWIIILKRVI